MQDDRDEERERSLELALHKAGSFLKFVPFCLDSTNSTQDYLASTKQAREGYFAVSVAQSQGRGREGREWISDEGGLYLSLLLEPRSEDCDKLTSLCAISILETLKENSHKSEYKIKEPNDVMCNGKKIAGVLVDVEMQGERSVAFCGMGVNVRNGENWSKELMSIATSLKLVEPGIHISMDEFLVSLLLTLDRNYFTLLTLRSISSQLVSKKRDGI